MASDSGEDEDHISKNPGLSQSADAAAEKAKAVAQRVLDETKSMLVATEAAHLYSLVNLLKQIEQEAKDMLDLYLKKID